MRGTFSLDREEREDHGYKEGEGEEWISDDLEANISLALSECADGGARDSHTLQICGARAAEQRLEKF